MSDDATAAALDALTGLLFTEATLDQVLGRLAHLAQELIAPADSVSIVLPDGRGVPRTLHSSDAVAPRLDEAQYEAQQGPGFSAWQERSVVRVDDLGVIAKVMLALRTLPPARIGDSAVESVEDLLLAASDQPSGDVLRYRLAGGSRVIVRPSGTEPKLKVYLDARADTAEEAARIITGLEAGVRALLEEHS